MINNFENFKIFKGIKESKDFFEETFGVILTPKNDNVTKNFYPDWERTSRDDIGDFTAPNGLVISFYPIWNEKEGFQIIKEDGHMEETLYIIQTSHTQKGWEEIVLQEKNLQEILEILGN